MTDPTEYDPDELRRMAFEGGEGDGAPGGPGTPRAGPGPDGGPGFDLPGAGEALDAARERELLRLDAATGEMERPYLPHLPEALAAEYAVFEWLDFLTRKGGFKRALRALEYYRSIGWIGEAAEERLREYLVGMDVERPRGEDGGLAVDDHLLSLVYVGRLASMAE
ncbi:MAG: FlaD/FlaE family flagellar protein [Haloferacaceae archaeon]